MKKIYFVILLLTQVVFCQAPAIEWQKYLGGGGEDYCYKVRQTNDGGYIAAINTNSTNGDVTGNHGGYDVWVVKLSSVGAIEWQKTFGGTNDDSVYSIEQTADGGYIAAGGSNSTNGDVTGNHGSYDIWVIKLNSNGDLDWQKSLGGSNYDFADKVKQTADGGYIVCGVTYSFNGDVSGFHGLNDGWIVKLSESGVIQWQKALGGTDSDGIMSVEQTADGGYIALGETGSSNGDVTENEGIVDVWVIKLNSSGVLQWQKTYGGASEDMPKSLNQTVDGGYVFTATTWSNDGDVSGNHGRYDAWIVKLSNLGIIQWQKTFGGTNDEYVYEIQQTSDGGYIFVSWTDSNDGDVSGFHGGVLDAWATKISDVGDLLWQKTIGGTNDDKVNSVQQTTDGGFIVSGRTKSIDGDLSEINGKNAWVFKLGPDNLAISEVSSQNIKLYPNPTTAILTLQSPNNLMFDKIIITDLTDKIVLQQNQNSNQIDVEKLTAGIYMLQAYSGNDCYIQKIVKK